MCRCCIFLPTNIWEWPCISGQRNRHEYAIFKYICYYVDDFSFDFNGYIAFFSPGGLGVREGAMFMMMKQFLTVEVALILPSCGRVCYVSWPIFCWVLSEYMWV